jgi:hypothetical protein
MHKLGQAFTSTDTLVDMDIGVLETDTILRLTYASHNLAADYSLV